MVRIKRRSFMQAIAATIFGGGLLKARKGRSACDICNEALEKIGHEPEYPLGTRKVLPDGRVFRYVKFVDKGRKGQLVQRHGIMGVVADDGWVQTIGPCMMNVQDEKKPVQLLYVELE